MEFGRRGRAASDISCSSRSQKSDASYRVLHFTLRPEARVDDAEFMVLLIVFMGLTEKNLGERLDDLENYSSVLNKNAPEYYMI